MKNVIDMQVATWLKCPTGDGNFKAALERANPATIRFALEEATGSTKKKILEAALKKAERQGIDPVSEAALEVVEVEQSREALARQEQADKEQRIAESYEIAGRIQALALVERVVKVSTLVQLNKIKVSKAYRDLPNIGTWDKYCDYLGISRQKIDMDLLNLSAFGEDFLANVSNFGLGYRDLRKLRQLTHDGTVTIDEAEIVIGGERIPFTPDHKDDLQNALERVIESSAKIIADKEATIKAKDKVLKHKGELIEKQSKELSRLEDNAAYNGLTAEEEALIQKYDNARTTIDGFLMQFDPERNPLPENPSIRMQAAYMGTLGYLLRAIKGTFDSAGELYGDVDLDEHQWIPPHLRKTDEG